MGFGFNLLFIFIILPMCGIMLLYWIVSGMRINFKLIGIVFLGFLSMIIVINILNWMTSKTVLDHEDYYGEYVIKRDFFKGPQSDWQYNHFRFNIKENDSIYFHVTEKERILKTYRGIIETKKRYHKSSSTLIVKMAGQPHHILYYNPTTYRSAWSFYLVFNSPKFYNVFFKKGEWKPID